MYLSGSGFTKEKGHLFCCWKWFSRIRGSARWTEILSLSIAMQQGPLFWVDKSFSTGRPPKREWTFLLSLRPFLQLRLHRQWQELLLFSQLLQLERIRFRTFWITILPFLFLLCFDLAEWIPSLALSLVWVHSAFFLDSRSSRRVRSVPWNVMVGLALCLLYWIEWYAYS